MSRLRSAARSAALVALCACGSDDRTRIVLYSPHGREQLELLEAAFEARYPAIDVRWLDMGSQEVVDRLRSERVNPQADVWFGGPTTLFDRGVADSLLAPFRPSWSTGVDPSGIGPGDLYHPVYRTPAVIAYNSDAVAPADVPRDWDDVLEPAWANQVLIRDPVASGTMRAIWGFVMVRSIEQTGDTAQGMRWLRRLDGQTKAYALNPAILLERLVRREGLVTLWDLPDVLIDQALGLPLGYVFPSSGTVVIDDAIGLVRGAKHPEAAKQFIEWAGSVEAQLLAARKVFRLPARTDLPPDSVPAWVGEVEREMVVTPMDWALVAREGAGWMRYWDQHVRGTGTRSASER